MAVLTKAEIAALSPEERLALIDELWESFGVPSPAAQDFAELEAWERELLDARLDDLEAHPADEISLDEARSRSLI